MLNRLDRDLSSATPNAIVRQPIKLRWNFWICKRKRRCSGPPIAGSARPARFCGRPAAAKRRPVFSGAVSRQGRRSSDNDLQAPGGCGTLAGPGNLLDLDRKTLYELGFVKNGVYPAICLSPTIG
jgi:hypothetical protein